MLGRVLKRTILYLCCLGWDLLAAWPMVLLLRALWGRDLRLEHGVLMCELRPETFPLGGRVDGRGLILRTGPWPRGWYLHNRAAAWLESAPRGFYRGSAHEVGAYAAEEVYETTGRLP